MTLETKIKLHNTKDKLKTKYAAFKKKLALKKKLAAIKKYSSNKLKSLNADKKRIYLKAKKTRKARIKGYRKANLLFKIATSKIKKNGR
jgi:hypothetical protein